MDIGDHYLIDSQHKLDKALESMKGLYQEHGKLAVKFYYGKRSLSQNAIKSIWYRDIARNRGDVTAKDVERECKYKYGLPIIRQDAVQDRVHAKLTDTLPYEWRIKTMDCYAVTSIMTPNQLSEYMKCMRQDYPYLRFLDER